MIRLGRRGARRLEAWVGGRRYAMPDVHVGGNSDGEQIRGFQALGLVVWLVWK